MGIIRRAHRHRRSGGAGGPRRPIVGLSCLVALLAIGASVLIGQTVPSGSAQSATSTTPPYFTVAVTPTQNLVTGQKMTVTVNRTAAGNSLEMSVEGGMAARAGNVVTQMTMAPGSTGSVQKLVLQVGANDPMEMPIEGAQAHQFAKPDPKTLVKEETIKVAAGSYKTKHYHDKTPQGDTVDYWVTESLAPIGLVKIEMTQKSNPMINGPIKMELLAVGKDAKTIITKKAKPFDQAALMKEMTAGSGAPGGGAPAGK